MQNAQQPMQNEQQAGQMPSLNEIYQNSPQELRNQIEMMAQQGMNEQQIMQMLMGGGQGGV